MLVDNRQAGAQRKAAEHGIALVVPDTSPRGLNIEGESDSYDLGLSASYYMDATVRGAPGSQPMVCCSILRRRFGNAEDVEAHLSSIGMYHRPITKSDLPADGQVAQVPHVQLYHEGAAGAPGQRLRLQQPGCPEVEHHGPLHGGSW